MSDPLSDETIEKYKGYNIDLVDASGHDHLQLPVPAVFIIDASGIGSGPASSAEVPSQATRRRTSAGARRGMRPS